MLYLILMSLIQLALFYTAVLCLGTNAIVLYQGSQGRCQVILQESNNPYKTKKKKNPVQFGLVTTGHGLLANMQTIICTKQLSSLEPQLTLPYTLVGNNMPIIWRIKK